MDFRYCLPLLLTACTTPSVVRLPTQVQAQVPPVLAQDNTGAIYHPATARLFFETRIAHRVGDAIVVTIEEDLSSSASRTLADKSNGATTVVGPAALGTVPGLVKQLFDVDVDSHYSIADNGQSSVKNGSKVNGSIMVSVLDVQPNGYLVVGGDKMVLVGGKQSVLRFTGSVDPAHIRPGNTLPSRYVINARLDQLNQDVPLDASVLAWVNLLFGAAAGLY